MAWDLWLLFGSAFLSATILPLSSEVVLAAIVARDSGEALWPALALATLGNSLGALVNWGLGRFATRFVGARWFPLSPTHHERASAWFQRFGVWSLLLAWVPVIGDPLTVVAGLLRVRLWVFLPLVVIGKGGRYLALALTLDAFL